MHVDVGTGDGAFVLRAARADPRALVIGLDANADAMREASRRAASKPSRGGVANALFVHASAEALPSELDGLAARVTVLFPWGSLLRAVWAPDARVLAAIRRACRDDAEVEVVVGIAARDATAFAGLEARPSERLLEAWRAAGFSASARESDPAEWPTSWSRRLSFDEARRFFALRASILPRP